jgi:hypothetical protein
MDRQLGSKPHWRGSSFTVLTSSPEVVRQYLPTLTNLPAVIDFAERIRGLRSVFGRLAGTSAETPSNFLNHRKVSTSSLLEVYGPLLLAAFVLVRAVPPTQPSLQEQFGQPTTDPLIPDRRNAIWGSGA